MAITLWSDVERGLTNTEFDNNFIELAAGCIAQSVIDNRPLVKPSLNLDFTKGVLDPRITFTRASTATYFGADGLLKTAGINEPRFEYDPVTRQPKGLLIEEQRTNIFLYSEYFNNPYWSKIGVTIDSDIAYSPTGNLSADKLTTTGGSDSGDIGGSVGFRLTYTSLNSSTVYTVSYFIKPITCNVINLSYDDTTDVKSVMKFNLTSLSTTVLTGTPSGKIEYVGGGWYRISMTFTSTTTGFARIGLQPSAGQTNGSYLFLWGAQLEVGSNATSYIPTTTAQVTRSADNARLLDISWFRYDQGSFYCEASTSRTTGAVFTAFGNTPSLQQFEMVKLVNNAQFGVVNNGAYTANLQLGSVAANPTFKIAGGYVVDNFAASVNGISPVTDISGQLPSLITTIQLGGYTAEPNTSWGLDGHIKKLSYYPVRLTNTQLQQLTSTV